MKLSKSDRFEADIPPTMKWIFDYLDVYPEDFATDPDEVAYFYDLMFLVRTFAVTINRLPKDASEFWGWEAGIARNLYLN